MLELTSVHYNIIFLLYKFKKKKNQVPHDSIQLSLQARRLLSNYS